MENKRLYEEVEKTEIVDAIFRRIEKEHGSEIARIVRHARHENDFHMTIILKNMDLLEVTLKPSALSLMTGAPYLECEISVF